MGVANVNMMGLIHLGMMVAGGSCGESTKARWTKTGLLVPDVVGVKVVPSGSNLM